MKFRIEHKSNYYKILKKWWKEHNFPILGYDALPENIFVAYNERKDICAIPTYMTDSDFCYLGFITINPLASVREKFEAIPFLTENIGSVVKKDGYNRLFITCSVSGLMKSLERSGFQFLEKTNYYLKNL